MAMTTTLGHLVYAVGDIHGRYDLLKSLLQKINLNIADRANGRRPIVIFCGDYVDRGPQASHVLEAIIWLSARKDIEVHTLKGNHEAMLLSFIANPIKRRDWLSAGGAATLISYGVGTPRQNPTEVELLDYRSQFLTNMPASHLKFLQTMSSMLVLGDYVFVHAGIDPKSPLTKQSEDDLLWIGREFRDFRGPLEKRVIHGHSWSGESPDVQKQRIGLDTGAYTTGILTSVCLDGDHTAFIQTGQSEQFDAPFRS